MSALEQEFEKDKMGIWSNRNCVEGKSIVNGIYPPTTDLPFCPLRIIN